MKTHLFRAKVSEPLKGCAACGRCVPMAALTKLVENVTCERCKLTAEYRVQVERVF